MSETIKKTKIMISGLNNWLSSIQYNYFEYNYVPERLFTGNHWINVFLRLFFRLSTINFRKKEAFYPIAPQSLVTLLRAYNIQKNKEVVSLLLPQLMSLKSPKANNFSLSQGIRIAVNLYENDAFDPAPLNTVWFGQYLLDDQLDMFSEQERRDILCSIADYLVEELGYRDHKEKGIYFYYETTTLDKEIYNANALISSFLLQVGFKYAIDNYKMLGERGIKYILYKQNKDGSWFYSEDIKHTSIDNFHQSYILQALCQARQYVSFSIENDINNGIEYYKNRLFKYKGKYIIPFRYDKRYLPGNTWLLQKIDGRDLADALIFFSKYSYDREMLDGLINYIYDFFYIEKKGYLVSESLLYGKNKIPYLEFQAWYLYSFETILKYY